MYDTPTSSEDRKRGMTVVRRSEKNFQKPVPPSTVCVPGIELRSSGSAESTQTHWTICQPLPHVCFIYLFLIRVLRINLYSPVEGCPESCEFLHKRTPLKGWRDSGDCQSVVSDLNTSNSCQIPDGREVLWAVKVQSWYWLWVVNVRTKLK